MPPPPPPRHRIMTTSPHRRCLPPLPSRVPPLVLALVVLGLLVAGPAGTRAQMELTRTVKDLSGWPCTDYTWQDCAEVVPEGGYGPADWYKAGCPKPLRIHIRSH